jgi:cell division protein FtsQ
MKLPGPGRLMPVPLAEPHPANEDAPKRRRLERPARKPELPLDAEVEPPFLRPERRTRPRRLRRGPVWDSVRIARWGACAVLVALGLWLGYSRAMASERLQVARVDVRGGHFLSEGEVRELLGPAVGQNILSLDIEELKARLRASPWVADATVTRSLPDTLRVEIHERHPLALAEMDRLYLMDSDGGLVDLHGPRTADFDLPIVRGLTGLTPDERRERTRAAGAVLHELAELGAVVSEVWPESGGDVRLVLRGTSDMVLVGAPPCRDRVATFLGLRDQLAARVPAAEYWDLRFKDRIFAKPAPTPKPPPTPPAAPVLSPTTVPSAPVEIVPPDGGVRVLPAASPQIPTLEAIPVAATVPLTSGGR